RPARPSITRPVGRDDGQRPAELRVLVQGHRGTNPVGPGLVRGTHDDGSPGTACHSHRHAAKLRVVTLVDGRVEGVEVDVEDGPGPVVRSRHLLCSGQSATTTCGRPWLRPRSSARQALIASPATLRLRGFPATTLESGGEEGRYPHARHG